MFYLNSDAPSHPGGPSPKESGWLYLAYDYHDLNKTKIGITTRPILERIRESTLSPGYALFAAFHVPDHSKLDGVEKYIRWKLHTYFVPRLSSGKKSEVCTETPSDVLGFVVGKLPNYIEIERDVDGEYDFTKTIYLPKVNPYAADLEGKKLDRYVRFAAPETFLSGLREGWIEWDAKSTFLEKMETLKPNMHSMAICGPQLLLDRLAYDYVLRSLQFP